MSARLLPFILACTVGAGCAVVYHYGDYQEEGQGGASSSAATGGATSSATGGDCNCPMDSVCAKHSCVNGACKTANVAKGTAVADIAVGDCKKSQCDGSGAIVRVNDDKDLPVDGNECTDDVCAMGVPSNPPKPEATKCGANLALVCDNGMCLGCKLASDCAPSGNPCLTTVCNAPQCVTQSVSDGTVVGNADPHDCLQATCMAGVAKMTPDDAETPASDGNPCHTQTCVNGVANHPAIANDTPCGGSGAVCHGGQCGCTTAADCDAVDCSVASCTNGVCNYDIAPDSTPCNGGSCCSGACCAGGSSCCFGSCCDLSTSHCCNVGMIMGCTDNVLTCN